ncbi:MAG: short-chain dehydrogenase/reductase [Bryobacterales bacterium]|nr:short-chain dehydrogenase/reductase [Bryobacterales bacterium]
MASSLFDLDGEVVAITGGAGFLGRTYAQAISEAGGIPVLLDINEPALEGAAQQIGGPVATYRCDITEPDDIRAAHRGLIERFDRIGALINNAANNPTVSPDAGMAYSGRLETMSLAQWQADIDVGLTGAFLCSQIFGAHMAAAGGGSIVNISSDLGVISPDQRLYRRENIPEPEQTVKPITYSAVKTGILGLTRYLATYWAKQNVRANAVCLGGVLNGQPETFLNAVAERIPLGRLARCEEYKGPIVFLCSRASSYMTGATLVIDGGRTIW